MTDPISLMASIVTLAQVAGKVATLGYQYINGAIRAPKHLRELLDELNSLGKALEDLQDYTDKNPKSIATQKLNDPNGPLKRCTLELGILKSKLEPKDGFKKVIHSLKWPLKENEILQQILRIERYKSLLTLALNVDHISLSSVIESCTDNTNLIIRDLQQEFQVQSTTQNSGRQKSEALRIAEKRQKILKWLGPELFDKIHIETNSKRHKKTGEWLLKKAAFHRWVKKHPDYTLLWGYGIPGAGKTFLSSFIIDHLQFLAETENYGVAYIYFDFKEYDQQKPIQVLASLVKQLLNRKPDSPALSDLEALYDNLKSRGEKPTFEELYPILVAASKSFSRTFLVFDALDECQEENQRNELLQLFQRMTQGNHNFSLFITSRPYPEGIQDSLRDAAKIELSAQEEDIKIYIRQKIAESSRARRLVRQGKCEDRIISELVDCAKGMFLLVRFHIEHICQQTTVKQILMALNKIRSFSSEERPLDPFYDRAIDNLFGQPQGCVDLALSVLSWLTKARRTLTIEEIQVAVSVESERYELDESDLPDKITILDVCAGLVTIDENTNTIRLAHYTVQEYLINNHIVPEDTEFRLAMACATYLSFDIFATGACKSSHSLKHRLELHPFLDYAASQLASHLKACDEHLTTNIILRFLERAGSISSYLQASCCRKRHQQYFARFNKFPRGRLPLHIACALGHVIVVRRLLDRGSDISATDGNDQSALHIAAFSGHVEVVQLLLGKGAIMSALDSFERTALHLAASEGHQNVILLLLERDNGETPLHEAVIKGCKGIARLLLEEGADMSIWDDRGMSPLHWASFQGDIEMIGLLVERGVPEGLSLQDWNNRTALHWAMGLEGEKCVETIRLLLENGVDYSLPDRDGLVPLHQAAERGHTTVVILLLASGADPSVQDNSRQTALYKAMLNGHKEIISLLLQKRATISLSESYSSMYSTAPGEYVETIQLLLGNGVDYLLDNEIGRTALHEAIFWDREELARFLIENGTPVSIPDNDGQTPLHEAASEGHEAMVRLLIEKGASTSAPDNFGQTPLHEAACGGYGAIVRLLLANGADSSALDTNGRAPSHYAECPEVLLLLKKASKSAQNSNAAGKIRGEKILRVISK